MKNDYPKMLYRAGSEIEWEGKSLDTLIVDDAEGESAAVKEGWSADPAKKGAK